MKNTLYLFIFLLISTSCAFNNEEDLYNNQDCSTEDVTYSGTVVPILEANCYTCHDSENANTFGAGIQLEGYTAFKLYVTNGRLLGAIKHQPGFSAMPRSSPQLSECTIQQIETWINEGSIEN